MKEIPEGGGIFEEEIFLTKSQEQFKKNERIHARVIFSEKKLEELLQEFSKVFLEDFLKEYFDKFVNF